jgi:hypothetical protein
MKKPDPSKRSRDSKESPAKSWLNTDVTNVCVVLGLVALIGLGFMLVRDRNNPNPQYQQGPLKSRDPNAKPPISSAETINHLNEQWAKVSSVLPITQSTTMDQLKAVLGEPSVEPGVPTQSGNRLIFYKWYDFRYWDDAFGIVHDEDMVSLTLGKRGEIDSYWVRQPINENGIVLCKPVDDNSFGRD